MEFCHACWFSYERFGVEWSTLFWLCRGFGPFRGFLCPCTDHVDCGLIIKLIDDGWKWLASALGKVGLGIGLYEKISGEVFAWTSQEESLAHPFWHAVLLWLLGPVIRMWWNSKLKLGNAIIGIIYASTHNMAMNWMVQVLFFFFFRKNKSSSSPSHAMHE